MPGWVWFVLGCGTGSVIGGLAVLLGVAARLADHLEEHPPDEGHGASR